MAKKATQPQQQEQQGTELALFPKLNLPSVTGITEEMNKSFGTMYTRIEAGIAELPTDMSIKANREKVASYAYSISRTKTGLDEAAATVSSDAKQIVDAVNAERRQLKNTLDILRDKARERLDAWEREEEKKEERRGEMMGRLMDLEQRANFGPSARLRTEIADLMTWTFDAKLYGEPGVEALENRSMQTIERLRHWAEHFEKAEAEQRELEELRREKAEREEKERQEREAREAAERAEQERQRQEEERARIAKEAAERAEREAAERIENERKEREAAERRAQEAEERRQREAEEAEARRIREAEEAAERQRQAEERAAQAERDRIERERLAKEKADQERAADLAHRRKFNSEAADAIELILRDAGTPAETARNIIIEIYQGRVPHVSISY